MAAGFLYGIFLIWRLARAWDLDQEKVLDLTLVTFVGGLIGARIYFALENPAILTLPQIFLIHKFPGFSFWGAILGGWLTLFLFAKRFKLEFLQAADIASVGLLSGMIFANMGCLLGGCNVGIPSNLFFALYMSGAVGKRIPVQGIEALLLILSLRNIWHKATHFHLQGTVVSLSLIYIGIIKLLTEPLRETHRMNYFLALTLVILGIVLFYKVTKRQIVKDLSDFVLMGVEIIKSGEKRKSILFVFKKNWYNFKVSLWWKVKRIGKILRRLNVRFSHKTN